MGSTEDPTCSTPRINLTFRRIVGPRRRGEPEPSPADDQQRPKGERKQTAERAPAPTCGAGEERVVPQKEAGAGGNKCLFRANLAILALEKG